MTGSARDINDKLSFLRIDRETRATLRAAGDRLDQDIDGILERFYDHVTAIPELREMLGSESSVRRIRGAQGKHWARLFEGTFDAEYQDKARRIGEAHHRANLSPSWYLGGYCFVLNELTEIAVRRYRWQPKKLTAVLAALNKAVFLDMDCAIEVYNDAVLEEREARRRRLDEIVGEFDAAVSQTLEGTAEAGGELDGIAGQMREAAETSRGQAGAAEAASGQASGNVQTVSAAAEELSSSISEISAQVSRSTQIAGQASREAESASATVRKLAGEAASISEVVDLIREIAEQTNLLALNATIEAARAGEAGKGFAVVANEVKALAKQTAEATDRIDRQASGIQSASDEVVSAIDRIGGIIGQVDEISGSVAAAMEEQSAATAEIARNVQEAATGTDEVSRAIGEVAGAAGETRQAADQVAEAVAGVSRRTDELRTRIQGFLDEVKVA